jgi:hypothetical protein
VLTGRNCLRSTYVNFLRVESQERGPRKSLPILSILVSFLAQTGLTPAFGGQRSIQLSYGCWGVLKGRRAA